MALSGAISNTVPPYKTRSNFKAAGLRVLFLVGRTAVNLNSLPFTELVIKLYLNIL